MGSSPQVSMQKQSDVSIRLLREKDLPTADRIMRLAFGTFLGPSGTDQIHGRRRLRAHALAGGSLRGHRSGVRRRNRRQQFRHALGQRRFFRAAHDPPGFVGSRNRAAAAAADDGSIREMGRAARRAVYVCQQHEAREACTRNSASGPGISPRSWRFLFPRKPCPRPRRWARFSDLSVGDKELCIQACTKLTNSVYEGLDVQREIRAVDDQQLGDTVLTWGGGELTGFAVCHAGPGTEAGSGKCYIKFGAVRSGKSAAQEFRHLLEACR